MPIRSWRTPDFSCCSPRNARLRPRAKRMAIRGSVGRRCAPAALCRLCRGWQGARCRVSDPRDREPILGVAPSELAWTFLSGNRANSSNSGVAPTVGLPPSNSPSCAQPRSPRARHPQGGARRRRRLRGAARTAWSVALSMRGRPRCLPWARARAMPAGADALDDDAAFKLREHAEHLKQGPAGGGCCVDALLM